MLSHVCTAVCAPEVRRYDIIAIFVLVARLIFNHARLLTHMPSPQVSLIVPLPPSSSSISSPTSTLSFPNPIFPNRRITVDEATYDRDGDPKVTIF